jgi:nickel/cobalt exporter
MGFHPHRVEMYISVMTELLVIGIGLWLLQTQLRAVRARSAQADHIHEHDHAPEAHNHRHGWGLAHAHDIAFDLDRRPKLAVLLGLGVAGGLLPDPGALAILLAALASGKVILGFFTVLIFSLGFACVLVVVGIAAALVGDKVLGWLDSR